MHPSKQHFLQTELNVLRGKTAEKHVPPKEKKVLFDKDAEVEVEQKRQQIRKYTASLL